MRFVWLVVIFLTPGTVLAQQTVFNVPSADVLERGKVYLEVDATVRTDDPFATVTPRIVVGIGRNIEIGVNLGAFSTADGNVPNIAPAIKWKIHAWERSGVTLFAGDTVFIPLRRPASLTAGNYAYMQLAKQFTRTRVSAGIYHFSAEVVRTQGAVGAQLSIEHVVSPRVSLAADWYSGNNSAGYVTPGAIMKLSKRLTLYSAYQLGNRGIRQGNHQFLFEMGWNLN